MPSAFSSSTAPFVKKKDLAASGQKFCIEGARIAKSKEGREFWCCTIFLLEDGILVEKALPFDRSEKRDAYFEGKNAAGTWPQHDTKLIDRTFPNRKTGMMQNFYDLDFEHHPASCPCGDLNKATTSEEEEVPDLEDHPF